jgi:carboxyl-terminal processing protease
MVVLTRERVTVPPLTTTITTGAGGRRIGTISVTTLGPGSEQAIDQALGVFERANVVGWVLDLREAGGGSSETLTAVAGRFLDPGQTVAYRVRDGEAAPLNAGSPPTTTPQRPLAVVINGGTREMPEALAAALRDTDRARLFGEATAGCVSLTTIIPLADGSALQLGIAQLHSPTRRPLVLSGQQPDEIVWPRYGDRVDPPLAAAQEWVEKAK